MKQRASKIASWLSAALLAGVLMTSAAASASPRGDVLRNLLASSREFRVRSQAALALGAMPAEPGVTDALRAALRDEHPAVRLAAAASLSRLSEFRGQQP